MTIKIYFIYRDSSWTSQSLVCFLERSNQVWYWLIWHVFDQSCHQILQDKNSKNEDLAMSKTLSCDLYRPDCRVWQRRTRDNLIDGCWRRTQEEGKAATVITF